ncbi:energy-coupling factor transporter transmembrane component T [Leuconostocaceae bacterium ESL0958]|nr:energy-coupling factor transporter transmembrane component T [Leuconostocaceae bacterium ESL0958]
MNGLVIGQFVPGHGPLYRLDPRTKILVTLAYVFLLVFANHPWTYVWSGIFLAAVLYASGQKASLYWKGLKPVFWLILFTVFLQVFFTGGQPVLWQWSFLKVTGPGLVNAFEVVLRFTMIVLMSTTLTLTTAPTQIAGALEALLRPLKKIKVPVAELSLMLSIALRFVPLLVNETEKIMKAQKSRGMSLSSGSLIARSKAVVPLLVPLFVGALQRALDLANAMEVRGFQSADQRTRYRQLAFGSLDGTVAALTGLFVLGFGFLWFYQL